MKYLAAILLALMISGCTVGMVDMSENNQIEGQHEKALKLLGQKDGTLVYKATDKAKKCLRDKLEARGYWMLQDEIDCWDNSVK